MALPVVLQCTGLRQPLGTFPLELGWAVGGHLSHEGRFGLRRERWPGPKVLDNLAGRARLAQRGNERGGHAFARLQLRR
eukprot:510369-Lingulodinium_polyedra.AAC.1